MSSDAYFMAAEGLGFQGRIAASVSHELNNVLATISETAGLLADLTELAGSGRRLDTADLSSCAETIVDEVKRGFRVVKNLNVFAHSADEPVAEVKLAELVALVARLAGYLSFSSSVEFQGSRSTEPRLKTRPLLLEALVYRVIVNAFREVGPEGSVRVTTEPTRDGGRIVFSGVGSRVVEDEVTRIAQVLDCTIEIKQPRNEVHILVPRTIKNDTVDSNAPGPGQ